MNRRRAIFFTGASPLYRQHISPFPYLIFSYFSLIHPKNSFNYQKTVIMNNLTSSFVKNILTSILFLAGAVASSAQSGTVHLNESNPAMRFEVKDGMLYITCRSGCAFTDLSFTLEPGQSQLVNEYGMTTGEEISRDPQLSNFTMSVKKNKRGDITIKNVEGMSFKKIKFQRRNDANILISK